MALAAMEIFASDATSANKGGSSTAASGALSGGVLPVNVSLSASMAAAGTAFQIPAGANGPVLVRCLATADAFVAVGATSAEASSNASTTGAKRQPVKSSLGYYDFYAKGGDWVAWAVA